MNCVKPYCPALEKLFRNSFKRLHRIAISCNDRLLVPQYRDGGGRISEQELKHVFIQEFLSCPTFEGWKYSIETPSVNIYKFTCGHKPLSEFKIGPDHGGRSANIDLCLYCDNKPSVLIEFKANNPGYFEHGKDFFKLENEPNDSLKYFVELYQNTNKATMKSIEEKLFINTYCKLPENVLFLGFSLYDKDLKGPAQIVVDRTMTPISIKAVKI